MSVAANYSLKPSTEQAGRHPLVMIGLWKLGRTIGKGSSGRVKIARHSVSGKLAAVKIIPKRNSGRAVPNNPPRSEDDIRLARSIEREIVIMKLIDHPHVLKLYDVWETSNQLYLILEYIEGGELFDYIVQKGRLDLQEALRYFQQIIYAVHYCHCFNIAHRDLKPENILLDKVKNVKIADFGMAVWEGTAGMLETSCGSPHYASPEILNGKRYSGASADVWSCGVILYALVSGSLPFHDEDIETLLTKVRLGEYQMPKDIPKEAQNLIFRMLQKDVSKRITIPEIMEHPFFQAQPTAEPTSTSNILLLKDILSEPISKLRDVDADVFSNLRTLWPELSDKALWSKLQSKERTWQKAVYYLLCKYRTRELDDCEGSRVDSSKKHEDITQPDARLSEAASRARHVREGKNDQRVISQYVVVESSINSSETQKNDSSGVPPILPPLEVTTFDDDGVQTLFHQFAKHFDLSQSANVVSPSCVKESPLERLSLDQPRLLRTTGKFVRRAPKPKPQNLEDKKENLVEAYSAPVQTQATFSKWYQRNTRHFRVLQDSNTRPLRNFDELHGVKFAQRWLPVALRPKKASFILLSTKDLPSTREECSRLLQNLHVNVTVVRGYVLKCVLREGDMLSHLQGTGSLHFRVRVVNSVKLDAAAGYPTCMSMILEKGERKAFRAICDGLRRDWYYDVLPTPTSILLSST